MKKLNRRNFMKLTAGSGFAMAAGLGSVGKRWLDRLNCRKGVAIFLQPQRRSCRLSPPRVGSV